MVIFRDVFQLFFLFFFVILRRVGIVLLLFCENRAHQHSTTNTRVVCRVNPSLAPAATTIILTANLAAATAPRTCEYVDPT